MQLPTLEQIETRLRSILTATPNQSHTLNELEQQVHQTFPELGPDDVRQALWNLYHQGVAQSSFTPEDASQDPRWMLAKPQNDLVKNRQAMWSGNIPSFRGKVQ